MNKRKISTKLTVTHIVGGSLNTPTGLLDDLISLYEKGENVTITIEVTQETPPSKI